MKSIDVHFDYISPFAYIASEVLPEFAERLGVVIRWKPIDMLGLSNYADGLPYSTVKRRYVVVDAARSAEYHGVSIRPPEPHPVPSRRALGIATAALGDSRFPKLHRALFRAAWRDRRDLGADEVLTDCIGEADGPAEEWMAAAEEPGTLGRLEARTGEAEAAGVFGVPSISYEGELFWGVDSLPVLAWRIEGRRALE